MDLASVSDELYGAPPEQFVERRKQLATAARAEGRRELAKQVQALRRPSRGAWLVNLLVRNQPAAVRELLDLGPALAQMHTTGTPEQLRELSGMRRHAVQGLVAQAVALATERGYRPSDAVRREVEVTLEAALAHPQAAGQVLGGALVQTPESAAAFPLELFQDVEPAVPVAAAEAEPELAPVVDLELVRARNTLARAEADAAARQAAAKRAEQAARESRAAAEGARTERDALARRRDELQRELDEVLARLDASTARAEELQAGSEAAAAEQERAAALAAEAQAQLVAAREAVAVVGSAHGNSRGGGFDQCRPGDPGGTLPAPR